jgi:hypothetical protein
MATTSIRWEACKKIVQLIGEDPLIASTSVSVQPGWPGDRIVQKELIWIDEITGDTNIPVMTGGRKQREDDFEITLNFRITGLYDISATMDRTFVLIGIVEDILANDTTLGALDGVLSAEITSERMSSAMFPEGPVAFAELKIQISSRLL